ncbi:MAG: hypothetical protein O2930_12960 [Acidobacteria bacterium]|nr:hypothetical protein [Acidobacteriota bacterium]
MTVTLRALGVALLATMLVPGGTPPVHAGQNPYEGVLASATCSPGVAFTAISMGWDLDYLYGTDFGGLGPCVVPDLSDLLGTWILVSQQVQAGPNTLIGNSAGKTLQILPRAIVELDPTVRGVMAQEEWLTEQFCIEGAAAAPTCGMTLPALPAGLGATPCRESAVFGGAVRSDVYVQSSGSTPSQPVGPFTLRANIRTDMTPVSIRCPGADIDVTCGNCASMSIGKMTMVLEYDQQSDVLTARSDLGGPTVVQTFRRETTLTLGEIFNPDGSLQ